MYKMAVSQPVELSEAGKEIKSLVDRARAAQKQIENYSQEQVDQLLRAMVWSVARPGVAEAIAKQAVEETALGNYEGKFTKMSKKCRAALFDIIDDVSVGVIEELPERNIIKVAKPIGVVGALTPCTNPEATPVIKAMNALKGRNAIVIAPHPRAKITTKMLCDKMRAALKACGAPEDLVIAIEQPSLDGTAELMKQCDVVLATGGGAMVKAAYSSGTPALGVGAGNACITVDETADLDDAARKIKLSKTFDYATSCSSDNNVIAVAAIHDALLEKLQAEGGYLVTEAEYPKFKDALWPDGSHLNPDIIAQSAQRIAEVAGVSIPEDKSFIIVPENGAGPEHMFSGEKLSVVMGFHKVADVDEAVALTNAIQEYQGLGHSCGLYTTNDKAIEKFAMGTKTSRVMINQPQSLSNSANVWNGMRQTFSLGCGFWGGNSVNDNINWRHLVNISWVSRPLDKVKVIPSDEDLFGDAMDLIK
ncbi:aldehyde dehydrogenase family protein [Dasania marina]|uniref:aldehyde dehydrogenase family protein n=1 Tax=Dasania marina TaxID=471499 RepID=UPI0030DBAF99|tara:strand:- start:96762 stop:98192 length:1431 start_codon:yes stop_codon:yes gene_type:complete